MLAAKSRMNTFLGKKKENQIYIGLNVILASLYPFFK